MSMTPEQQKLDAKLWWTTVRPWLAHMTSWPTQPHTPPATCPNCGCLLQHHYDDGCARCICPTSNTEAVYRRTLEQPCG